MAIRVLVPSLAGLLGLLLVASLAGATTFNVSLTSGEGQFPDKDPAAFGEIIFPTDIELTADQTTAIAVNQFTNFIPRDVFPYSPGASTTFTQTLTVNGVSTSVVRTVTLELSGDGCTLVQALSPVALTVDLGTSGQVTLELPSPPTLAYPCSNGKPNDGFVIIVIPGTTHSITATILDDYVVYKTKTTKNQPKLAPFGPVTLADALGGGEYDVFGINAIAAPASVNDGGRFDSVTHLASYRLKRRKTSPKFVKVLDVPVTTACGDLVVTAAKPESLLVPVNASLESPPPLVEPATSLVDHFLCYKAKLQKKRSDGTRAAILPKKLQLEAIDAFQARRYDVKKVTRLCLPVAKSGAPAELKSATPVTLVPASIRHPASQLLCYQAKAAKQTIAQTACGPIGLKAKGARISPPQAKHVKRVGLLVNGQLGAASLDTAKEQEVCAPILSGLE